MARTRTTERRIPRPFPAPKLRDNGKLLHEPCKEKLPVKRIPAELLELIMSKLSLRDNVRASSVCWRWDASAHSVRRINRVPLLICLTMQNESYFDDLHHLAIRTYFISSKNRPRGKFCYANCEWMMFFDIGKKMVSFFCLATRTAIVVPPLDVGHLGAAAFTSNPSSTACVVITLNCITEKEVSISTYRKWDSSWTTLAFANLHPFTINNDWNQIVMRNDIFYIYSINGRIGVYNPRKLTWKVLNIILPKCVDAGLGNQHFMAEHKGNIFLVCACFDHPIIYKLDIIHNKWQEIGDLGGATVFANPRASIMKDDMVGVKMNTIFLPSLYFYDMRCVSFSLDEKKFSPGRGINLNEEAIFTGWSGCDIGCKFIFILEETSPLRFCC